MAVSFTSLDCVRRNLGNVQNGIVSNNSFQLGTGISQLYAIVHFKRTGGSNGIVFMKKNGTSLNGFPTILMSSTAITLRITHSGGSSVVSWTSPVSLDNTWIKIGVQFDGTNNRFCLYVNDVLVAQTALSGNPTVSDTSDKIYMGYFPGFSGYDVDGYWSFVAYSTGTIPGYDATTGQITAGPPEQEENNWTDANHDHFWRFSNVSISTAPDTGGTGGQSLNIGGCVVAMGASWIRTVEGTIVINEYPRASFLEGEIQGELNGVLRSNLGG